MCLFSENEGRERGKKGERRRGSAARQMDGQLAPAQWQERESRSREVGERSTLPVPPTDERESLLFLPFLPSPPTSHLVPLLLLPTIPVQHSTLSRTPPIHSHSSPTPPSLSLDFQSSSSPAPSLSPTTPSELWPTSSKTNAGSAVPSPRTAVHVARMRVLESTSSFAVPDVSVSYAPFPVLLPRKANIPSTDLPRTSDHLRRKR
jgi:hypothetical protein